MLRHCLSRLLPAVTTLAAFATPALAQDLSPIQTMLETVEAALPGPIGIAVATLAIIVPSLVFFVVEWWRGQKVQFWNGAWWLLYLGGLCLATGLLAENRPLHLSTLWQHIVVGAFAVGVFPLAVRSRLDQIAPEGEQMLELDDASTGRR